MHQELLASKHILVVGDSMLDRYWFGDAHRISPEAPVPIVRIQRCDERLGGAANVALNIRSLGIRASLMTVIGNDEPGHILADLLEKAGIGTMLHVDASLSTTVKLRIVARQQQMLRADFENHPNNEVLAALLGDYETTIASVDAVILSDYGKGGLDHIKQMISEARRHRKPVLIDPKGDDYERYRGATVITPNRAELALVVGNWKNEEELRIKAQNLRAHLELDALLLTRSEEGMTLYTADGELTVPAQAREVFDVSGAGDTVIAVMASMLAAGLPALNPWPGTPPRSPVRPYGVSLLIIGWEGNCPTLWQVDPSGSYWAWKATALGKRSDSSRTFLERRYTEDLSVDDAIHTAISTLKEGFDGQLTADLIEIGVVDETKQFRTLSTAEIQDFLTEV